MGQAPGMPSRPAPGARRVSVAARWGPPPAPTGLGGSWRRNRGAPPRRLGSGRHDGAGHEDHVAVLEPRTAALGNLLVEAEDGVSQRLERSAEPLERDE